MILESRDDFYSEPHDVESMYEELAASIVKTAVFDLMEEIFSELNRGHRNPETIRKVSAVQSLERWIREEAQMLVELDPEYLIDLTWRRAYEKHGTQYIGLRTRYYTIDHYAEQGGRRKEKNGV